MTRENITLTLTRNEAFALISATYDITSEYQTLINEECEAACIAIDERNNNAYDLHMSVARSYQRKASEAADIRRKLMRAIAISDIHYSRH